MSRKGGRYAALLAGLAAVNCGLPPPAPIEVRANGHASPPPTAVAAASPTRTDAERALDAKLGTALAYVVQLRGLPQKSAVRGRLIGRGEIARYVEQQIDAQAPPDVIAASEALLFGLGAVPASFDYRESLLALMSAQLLGFYDPKQKTFFVGGDLSGDEADATLWHELVHALQDQHYNLERLTEWQPDRGDGQAAIHALAEGDATSLMLDALLKPKGTNALSLPEGLLQAEGVLGAAAAAGPPVLVRSLLAPYVDGLVFTNYLRRRGGFAAVDAAWRAPPLSTEQLLHPEKYLASEAPSLVELPKPPSHAPELAERFHDVLGEQTVRIVLEEWMPAKTAASAAADWGGDRVAVFSDEPRKRWAVAWHIRYDSEVAAGRALLAFARGALLPERIESSQATDYVSEAEAKKHIKQGRLCRDRHARGPFAVVLRGTDLGVTVGPFERNVPARPAATGCQAALAWAGQLLTR